MGDEFEAAISAAQELGVDGTGTVVKDMPGRRRIVRYGELVVKAFARTEHDAWRREVAGLAAVQQTGLTPRLVASGERWTAARWVEGVCPSRHAHDERALHRALGHALAQLHAVSPVGLSPWSVAERLKRWLRSPPRSCPRVLADRVARLTEDWLRLGRSDTLVHGDWGTSNVLLWPDEPARVLAIIDFEDAHLGDAAEDFRWQGMAGPDSGQLPSMLEGYGRSLGEHAAERIALATAEVCLDVLDWNLPTADSARWQNRCRDTLQALVDGWRPGD